MEQKRGRQRTGWNHRRYLRPLLGMARSGIGGNTQGKKGEGDSVTTKVRNQTESDGQTASSRTGSPELKAEGLSHNSRSGAICDICHTQKMQAQQTLGHYDNGKARILILSDSLSGLRAIERVWREERNTYSKINNGAVLEAITNVRETLFRNGDLHVGNITHRDSPKHDGG
eukprot:6194199-Pleurochrysis_carterae.AAC.1